MSRILPLSLVAALAVQALPGLARAQKMIEFQVDVCGKFACRELTKEETAMLGRVMSKLMGLLPTPDGEVYEQRGLKASQGIGWTMINDEIWQAASFPANVVDTQALGFGKGSFPRSFALTYSYALKDEGMRAKLGIGSSEHTLDNGDMEYFDVRIEVSAWAFAAPLESGMAPVAKGSDTFEKRLWGAEKGTSKLAVVVGPTAAKKGTPEKVPAESLAPIKAVRVLFQGPSAEVRALARRLDRGALRAMIGPIDKVIGLK